LEKAVLRFGYDPGFVWGAAGSARYQRWIENPLRQAHPGQAIFAPGGDY